MQVDILVAQCAQIKTDIRRPEMNTTQMYKVFAITNTVTKSSQNFNLNIHTAA